MYREDIEHAGLSHEEARVYETLLTGGAQFAAQIYSKVKPIKRATLYQVLRRLGDRGLLREVLKDGKASFIPESPDALLHAIESEAASLEMRRKALESALPALRSAHALSTETPTMKYYDGVEGLKEIYESHITSGNRELRFIRTASANSYSDTLGKWWAHYLRRRQESGVKVFGITPDDAAANHDAALDLARGFQRHWVTAEEYSAPIEIAIYGETVAIISFGREIFGMTMTGHNIALAFKQLFGLAQKGADATVVTHDHQ